MSDSFERYYDENIITGGKQGVRTPISKYDLVEYINQGLSSVKIAKKLNVSYTTIIKRVKEEHSELLEKLRENGKKCKIRRVKG